MVEHLELALALVELRVVSLLQRDPRVGLVHGHRELVPDALHRQVLSDGLELLAAVLVVLVPHPRLPHQADGLGQHRHRPHLAGVRRLRQPEVGLLYLLTRAHHVQTLPVHVGVLLKVLVYELIIEAAQEIQRFLPLLCVRVSEPVRPLHLHLI